MRRLVQRHHGNLPLETVESIWRVIISTFTYVQAPFSRPCRPFRRRRADARFRALPFRLHRAVRAAYGRVERRRGRHGIRRAISASFRLSRSPAPARGGRRSNSPPRRKSSRGCRLSNAPIIPPALPVFVVSRVAADAMVTETEVWSMRVSGWSAASVDTRCRARRRDRGARSRLRRRRPAGLH